MIGCQRNSQPISQPSAVKPLDKIFLLSYQLADEYDNR